MNTPPLQTGPPKRDFFASMRSPHPRRLSRVSSDSSVSSPSSRSLDSDRVSDQAPNVLFMPGVRCCTPVLYALGSSVSLIALEALGAMFLLSTTTTHNSSCLHSVKYTLFTVGFAMTTILACIESVVRPIILGCASLFLPLFFNSTRDSFAFTYASLLETFQTVRSTADATYFAAQGICSSINVVS